MKIGIESQRIFRKSKHGMDVVALELVRQLQAIDQQNEYLLFARDGDDRGCISDTGRFKTKILNGITYADWEQISLPAAVKKYKPQLLHCTANTAPLNCPVPMIVTVHDVIYLEEISVGGSAYQRFGNLYRRWVVPKIVRKAKAIITVSDYEKNVIAGVCKIDPEKIVVIKNGVSERFHEVTDAGQLNAFRNKLKLPEAFILFLGNTAPKKNTDGMIRAYVHYCSMHHHPLPLVVTDLSVQPVLEILKQEGRSELIRNIIMPGYVQSAGMPLLYNCSKLFVYPSFRESFGLPVLEAMACGIPVITSQIGALQEVAGEAAIFIDPNKPMNIAEAISKLITDPEKIDERKRLGLLRAKQFSWESSARKLIDVYTTSIASP